MTASGVGGRYPNALWRLNVLYSGRQRSIKIFASANRLAGRPQQQRLGFLFPNSGLSGAAWPRTGFKPIGYVFPPMIAGLHFEFHQISTLPRLAWCVRMRAGDRRVVVRHGPWVETGERFFFEGAWDGDFQKARPDASISVSGSGARLEEDRLVVVTATDPLEAIYLARVDDELFLSNSLPFALVQAGDEPDPDHAHYGRDFMVHAMGGIRRTNRTLATRRGHVTMHEFANLLVRPDLSVERQEKALPDEITDYESHVEILERVIAGVMTNAADRGRSHQFSTLATISQGYDSPALAALAARHGCLEGVTFYSTDASGTTRMDSGKSIGEQLGMDVSEHARFAYRNRSGCVEAEFCLVPPGGDVTLAAIEEKLAGKLLLCGRFGDRLWTCQADAVHRGVRVHPMSLGLGGRSGGEFRLRVGHLIFNPLFSLWQQEAAVRRISRSASMASWRPGGSYDRPIPCRILEEAGIPRSAVAGVKMAASGSIRGPCCLSPTSRRDYLRFVRKSPGNGRLVLLVYLHWMLRKLHGIAEHVISRVITRSDPRTFPRHDWSASAGSTIRQRWLVSYRRIVSPLLFHWGFHHVRRRYEIPAAVPLTRSKAS